MQDAEGESDRAVLTSFVKQFYPQATDVPAELVLPDDAGRGRDASRSGCAQAKGAQGRADGAAARREAADRRAGDEQRARHAGAAEGRVAGRRARRPARRRSSFRRRSTCREPPHRIECYDISHVQGTNQVASMVVFEDGQPKRSDYKRFKIKHEEGNNDFLSMQEVVRRRFTRALAADAGHRADGRCARSRTRSRRRTALPGDLAVEAYAARGSGRAQ